MLITLRNVSRIEKLLKLSALSGLSAKFERIQSLSVFDFALEPQKYAETLRLRGQQISDELDLVKEAEYRLASKDCDANRSLQDKHMLESLRAKSKRLRLKLAETNERANRANARVFEIALKQADAKPTNDVFKKMERSIRVREFAAVDRISPSFVDRKASQRIDVMAARAQVLAKVVADAEACALERKFSRQVQAIRRLISAPFVSIAQLIAGWNPARNSNIERAYELALQHYRAQRSALDKALEVSKLTPSKLVPDSPGWFSDYENIPELSANQEAVARELDENLKQQNEKLKQQEFNNQVYLREVAHRIALLEERVLTLEFACCRLYVVKVLISSMPERFGNMSLRQSFVQLALAICRLATGEEKTSEQSELTFFKLMSQLESQVLTLFIRIAKTENLQLSTEESAVLKTQFAEAEPVFTELKAAREANGRMWLRRAQDAAAEGLTVSSSSMSARARHEALLANFIGTGLDALFVAAKRPDGDKLS